MTRAIPKLQPSLFDELIIDNFAGGGGASLGMEMALGRAVDIAINHDPKALGMHEANHPYTTHYPTDVWEVDPVAVCKGRPVGLAWFSPDCKHFSKAKGGKPVSRKIRGLAWVVIKWAEKVKPRVIMLENVEEFQEWGPLVPACADKFGNHKRDRYGNLVWMPCPINKGATFFKWVGRLKKIGYRVDWRELMACDYGAPTIRKRLFLIARCDGLPIVWPQPTHGDPKSSAVKKGKLKPWRTAAECIDWTIPCPSIFDRKRPLADNTLRRIAKGIRRFVIDSPDPFVITYYGSRLKNDVDFRGFSLDEPVRTATTENRFGVVAPYIVPLTHHGNRPNHDVEEPFRTVTGANRGELAVIYPHIQRQFGHSIGHDISSPAATATAGGSGKSAVVCGFVVKHYGGVVGVKASTPFPTITQRGTQNQIATSHLIKLRGTCRHGQKVDHPAPTNTAGGLHTGEIRCFIVKYYGNSIGQEYLEPLHTITSKDRLALVSVESFNPPLTDEQRYRAWQIARLMEEFDEPEPQRIIPGPRHSAIFVHGGIMVDIGMRMMSPRELFTAQGFPSDYVIAPIVEGKALTKTDQVRMCGNSVSPFPAMALVKANVEIKAGVLSKVA